MTIGAGGGRGPKMNPDPTGDGGDLGGFHILPLWSNTNRRMMISRRKEEPMMASTVTVGRRRGKGWEAGWTTNLLS